MIYRFLFFFIIIAFSIFSQTGSLGSWNILNFRYSFNEKFSLFSEAQLRSLRYYRDFHYYEVKGGLEYKSKENVSFALGGGKYDTYQEGGNFISPKNSNEIRIWPQITVLNSKIWKLNFENRYRSEFRFIHTGFRLRFRYRTAISYSFGKENLAKNQIGISNELFFTNNGPYFERNRTQLFYSRKITSQFQIMLAYLNQFDYKINDETGRDFIQIGFYFDFKHKVKKND
jgi:hypothetical protein